MRTIRLLSMLFFLALFSFKSFAQENEKQYAIQVATFGSWEDFVQNKDKFTAHVALYAEKVGKRIKVYVLNHNSEYGYDELFFSGKQLDMVYKYAKTNHPGAFRRSDVKFDNLTSGWEIFERYKNNKLPTEFTAKGSSSAKMSTGKYKIQLGAFKEQKSLDYIAKNYGLEKSEANNVEELLSYDFKKVKKVICRRYFYGQFDSRADALAKKKALEKKSNRKLILVKM